MSVKPQFGIRRQSETFSRGPRVDIDFEGQTFSAYQGESLAAALLAAGVRVFSRSIKFHRPRSVFCLSGDCGACLMRIDGMPNQRACRSSVHEGLRCERQNAWPSASLDIFAAADEMFPSGMDHHSLMTSPRPLNMAMQKVVQRLGGLGLLPDEAPSFGGLPQSRSRHVSVAIVGAGPAGLAAAVACARAKRDASVVVIEASDDVGGSYLCDPRYGLESAAQALADAQAAGVEIIRSAAAIGFYAEEVSSAAPMGTCGLLAVATPQGMLKLSADRYVYATGGHEQNLLFVDNDRPGVLAGRAVGRLFTQYGLYVGEEPLLVGDGDYTDALATALSEAGAKVTQIDGQHERVERAIGRGWVRGADLIASDGSKRRISCDLIAVMQPPAPAFQLLQMHGATLTFVDERGFVVTADVDGRTSVPGVFACGEVADALGVAAALEHGARVGAAVAAELE